VLSKCSSLIVGRSCEAAGCMIIAVKTVSDVWESRWQTYYCWSDNWRRSEAEGRLWLKTWLPWHWFGHF